MVKFATGINVLDNKEIEPALLLALFLCRIILTIACQPIEEIHFDYFHLNEESPL